MCTQQQAYYMSLQTHLRCCHQNSKIWEPQPWIREEKHRIHNQEIKLWKEEGKELTHVSATHKCGDARTGHMLVCSHTYGPHTPLVMPTLATHTGYTHTHTGRALVCFTLVQAMHTFGFCAYGPHTCLVMCVWATHLFGYMHTNHTG